MKPRAERVADKESARRFRQPAILLGRNHLPDRLPLPQRRRPRRPRARHVHRRHVRQRLHPARAQVARRDAARLGHALPERFRHQEALELELLLRIPLLRHMRRQRPDQSARRPRADPVLLAHRDPRAPQGAFPGDGEAEDARAHHSDIRHCHPPRPSA